MLIANHNSFCCFSTSNLWGSERGAYLQSPGLRTKYIRYIHTAELVGHLEKETSLPPGDNAGPLVTKMTSERSQRSGRS
eukprot:3869837-Amphidinium_carterae.1